MESRHPTRLPHPAWFGVGAPRRPTRRLPESRRMPSPTTVRSKRCESPAGGRDTPVTPDAVPLQPRLASRSGRLGYVEQARIAGSDSARSSATPSTAGATGCSSPGVRRPPCERGERLEVTDVAGEHRAARFAAATTSPSTADPLRAQPLAFLSHGDVLANVGRLQEPSDLRIGSLAAREGLNEHNRRDDRRPQPFRDSFSCAGSLV